MIEPKHILRVQDYLDNVNSRHLSSTEDLLESFAELIAEQQEQIYKLTEYVEKQKQAESDRSANGLDSYYRVLRDE
jgi:hypothetical protein